MKYIFVPADDALTVEVRETQQKDPYQLVAEAGICDYGYGERVRTSHKGVYMMVHGDGHYMSDMKPNRRASKFYPFPPGIVGDAILIITEESGPNWNVIDWLHEGQLQTILDVLNG